MFIFLVVALLIAILAVIFALQNPTNVTVTFLTWRFGSSLALVLLLTFALGVLLGLLASVSAVIKRSWTISSQKKKIAQLEKSLSGLRPDVHRDFGGVDQEKSDLGREEE
ncbi:MAG TPA: DUF1049 domain-containing protein [Elusimicrobia bacterium]|jgi:uncharacterized integral membrane protein|nr:DUF1049 domain-containing protein [Elusimicrobiota bacterium]